MNFKGGWDWLYTTSYPQRVPCHLRPSEDKPRLIQRHVSPILVSGTREPFLLSPDNLLVHIFSANFGSTFICSLEHFPLSEKEEKNMFRFQIYSRLSGFRAAARWLPVSQNRKWAQLSSAWHNFLGPPSGKRLPSKKSCRLLTKLHRHCSK